MIFVWADTHFSHAGILKHCSNSRPYADVLEMNEALIARWNARVDHQDTIYLVGDFGFSHSKLPGLDEIFSRLHGHKHLVIGNHDEHNPKTLKLGWESIHDIVTIRENGWKAVACHYPMESWKGSSRGYLMLHGHSHGTLQRVVPHRFDVGADVYDGPVLLETLFKIASIQRFAPADHHGAHPYASGVIEGWVLETKEGDI